MGLVSTDCSHSVIQATILIIDVTLKVVQPESSFNVQQILFFQQVMPKEVILRFTISDVVKNILPWNPLLDFCCKLLPFSFWQPHMLDVSCVARVGIADLHFYFAIR